MEAATVEAAGREAGLNPEEAAAIAEAAIAEATQETELR
jgi:hypothetical protein